MLCSSKVCEVEDGGMCRPCPPCRVIYKYQFLSFVNHVISFSLHSEEIGYTHGRSWCGKIFNLETFSEKNTLYYYSKSKTNTVSLCRI